MPMSDLSIVIQWWSVLFFVGACAFPLTKRLFPSWFDRGYFFSKAVGMAVISYIVYVLGTLHIAPFTPTTVFVSMAVVFVLGVGVTFFQKKPQRGTQIFFLEAKNWKLILLFFVEEAFFFSALFVWSWVKAHEPSIRGLEKFMDFGFMQSILNSSYFPASDMWWVGGHINYYYFGHLVTAMLTKVSGLDLGYTFNLMLATIFALCMTMSFSIGVQMLNFGRIGKVARILGGCFTAFLVTMAGNMQTIYAFTKGYTGDAVEPFWKLLWSISELPTNLVTGFQTYWYANATRFIPYAIHEFPSYSFVVSDVHGHVLSIPFALLSIALAVAIFKSVEGSKNIFKQYSPVLLQVCFYSFLLGILLMTNALDGPIYGFLFALFWFVFVIRPRKGEVWLTWKITILPVALVAVGAFMTAMPFLWHFDSFATGIGINCPPAFLANSKIGPVLFETVDKCQKSPFWMMYLLWGLFWYTGICLFVSHIWKDREGENGVNRILKVFFLFSLGLIIFPEFFYVKDIYPAHFRSNTMFKLGYQAFMMWSLIAGYVITKIVIRTPHKGVQKPVKRNIRRYQISFLSFETTLTVKMPKMPAFHLPSGRTIFLFFLIPQVLLVSIFPIFAIRSYFGELRTYQSLYGFRWMEEAFPDDMQAVGWLKQETVKSGVIPVIVEADGDSYTDYNHVSMMTGYPGIVGWAVHEWLWRGTYDIVSPRRDDVRKIYESGDTKVIKDVLTTYNVTYIIVGKLEREKFTNLQEGALREVATPVFESGQTIIYRVTTPKS